MDLNASLSLSSIKALVTGGGKGDGKKKRPKFPKRDCPALIIREREVELIVVESQAMSAHIRVPIEGDQEAHLIEAIKLAWEQTGLKPGPCVVSFTAQDAFFRFFNMPLLPKGEWRSAAQFEARRYIPFKIDGLVWDCHIIQSAKRKRLEVVFAGVQKQTFNTFERVFAECELQPVVLEPQILSQARLVGMANTEDADQFDCIIDMQDEGVAHLVIVKNFLPYFVRDVNLSARSTSAEQVEGEQLPPVQDSESGSDQLTERQINRLLSELSVSVDFFCRENPSWNISKVWLFGKESYVESLKPQLTSQFSYSVESGTELIGQSIQGEFPLSALAALGALRVLRENKTLLIDYLSFSPEENVGKMAPAAAPTVDDLLKAVLKWVKTPEAITSAVISIILLFVMNLAGGHQLSDINKRLDQLKQSPLELRWNIEHMSADQVEKAAKQVQEQLSFIKLITNEKILIAPKLAEFPGLLPEGVWLTRFELDQRMDALGKDKLSIGLQGACYLDDTVKELVAIQDVENNVKGNKVFFKGLSDTRLAGIDQKEDVNKRYTYRSFSLECLPDKRIN